MLIINLKLSFCLVFFSLHSLSGFSFQKFSWLPGQLSQPLLFPPTHLTNLTTDPMRESTKPKQCTSYIPLFPNIAKPRTRSVSFSFRQKPWDERYHIHMHADMQITPTKPFILRCFLISLFLSLPFLFLYLFYPQQQQQQQQHITTNIITLPLPQTNTS